MADGGSFEQYHCDDIRKVHDMIHHEGLFHQAPGNVIQSISKHVHNVLFQWSDLPREELWYVFGLLDNYVRDSVQKICPSDDIHLYCRLLMEKHEREDLVIAIQRRILSVILSESISYERKYF